MKDITQVKNINPKNPENNNTPSQKVKTEEIKPNVILGMSVKRFLISSVITFFIIFLVILCSTVYLVKITISQTLSPTFLFFTTNSYINSTFHDLLLASRNESRYK